MATFSNSYQKLSSVSSPVTGWCPLISKRLGLPLVAILLLYITFNQFYITSDHKGPLKAMPMLFNSISTSQEHDPSMDKSNLSVFPSHVHQWLRTCGSAASLVILEPEMVHCLSGSSPDQCQTSLPFYRFGVSGQSASVLSKLISTSAEHGWKKVNVSDSGKAVILGNGDTSVGVFLIEQRQNYLFIHGNVEEEPSRAFLGINFTQSRISGVELLIPNPVEYYMWQWPRSRFIECNKTSAAHLRKKYPDIYSKRPAIDDSYIGMLAYTRDILLKYRTTAMLSGGTLLGWYRECGIIPDTTDLDLMFPAVEWKQELEEELKREKNLSLFWILGKPEDSLELSVYARKVKIDLFAIYQENNGSWVGGMIVPEKMKMRWWYPKYEGACTADLKGHLFYVTCDVLSFLKADYGAEWYEPHRNANFVWYSSHHNVQRIGKWTASEWNSVYRIFNNP